MNLRFFTIAAVGLLLLAADKPDDATKKELEKFQGTWNVESMLMGGADIKKGKEKMIFDGSKVTMSGGGPEYTGVVTLDPSTKPAAIDLVLTFDARGEKGPVKATSTWKGIYQMDGDDLKVALDPFGKDRPVEFASKPHSNIGLMVLKREKK